MKNYKLAIGAVAVAVFVTQQAAQATLTQAASGTATFTSVSSGPISVSYDVVYNSSSLLYTYLYAFTPLAGANIGQFEINTYLVNSVLTSAASFSGSPYTLTGSITSSGTYDAVDGNVTWTYSPHTSAAQLVGFTSCYGPTAGSGSLNDGTSGPWGDNATGTPIPVPAAVPEASTIISGILMLVPFGIGAARSLRKERTA